MTATLNNLETEHPPRTPFQESWRLLRKNKLALCGLAIFLLFAVTALMGFFLTSGPNPIFNPATIRLEEKLRQPLSLPKVDELHEEDLPRLGIYLFGTDDLGRDVFARMLQGAWVSLTVGFVAVGIAIIIGVFLGGVAGYFGHKRVRVDQIGAIVLLFLGPVLISTGHQFYGILLIAAILGHLKFAKRIYRPLISNPSNWLSLPFKETILVDTVVMRFVDIMLCFPSFFLILTVVALLPASIYNIMIIIGLTSWMGATRFVRAEFLSLRELDFVTAAKALGISDWRIIFRHMLPNAIAPVLVSATIGIASAILTEAGLSFLGFGVPPPHATWGNILSNGKRFIFDAPWLTFIPGFFILIVVLSFNLFGEGLRDILNPKLRERH
ncbi:MAG: ABC transporter permease [Deltaproteobacteria bacterium]|nr:ABC transporter permease [Deltaproteobacteria bacterium]